MPAHHSNPSIKLPEGFTIGYRKRALRGDKSTTQLASTDGPINLESGRHLLLARNGRGKTTLLKTIAGIIPSLAGKLDREGSIQFVDEDLRFDPEMKARTIINAFFKNGQRTFALEMAERIELDVEKPYGKLSKGNRQKVSLIVAETRARTGGPQILLLDEPFSGLDFVARDNVDAVWRETESDILRLVCVHPDEPTLQATSALVIRDEKLEQIEVDGSLDWNKTKESLN